MEEVKHKRGTGVWRKGVEGYEQLPGAMCPDWVWPSIRSWGALGVCTWERIGTRWPFFKERGHNACLSSYWAGSLELEVAPSGKPKGRVPLYAELAYRAGRNTHLSASAPTTSDVTLYFWWEHFSKEQPWI